MSLILRKGATATSERRLEGSHRHCAGKLTGDDLRSPFGRRGAGALTTSVNPLKSMKLLPPSNSNILRMERSSERDLNVRQERSWALVLCLFSASQPSVTLCFMFAA